MKTEYIPPEKNLPAFNCPKCHVYSAQEWFYMSGNHDLSGYGRCMQNTRFLISKCEHCHFPTIWLDDQMIFPLESAVEPPNPDLPVDIVPDYMEARQIVRFSPRGAAALLRLAIQKLAVHLGQPGRDLNSDIRTLVVNGLPPKVQEALDSVRVIGNEAVHPGTMDLKDDTETALALFKLVNFITQKMLTEPREIDIIYGSLPNPKLQAIAERDQK